MKKECGITFFYYDDIAKVAPFYEDVLGFELVVDQGLARIYRISGQCYFGIVDGNRGHLRHQKKSAALLTIVSEDVKGWHDRVKSRKVANISEVRADTFCEHFFFEDPAGYAIEIQRFLSDDVAKRFK